jgi:hypothetical protein
MFDDGYVAEKLRCSNFSETNFFSFSLHFTILPCSFIKGYGHRVCLPCIFLYISLILRRFCMVIENNVIYVSIIIFDRDTIQVKIPGFC